MAINEFGGSNPADSPVDIVTGPDQNLWFTQSGSIGRVTPSGAITQFTTGLSQGADPKGITLGPDGNLWFTEFGTSRIGRITTAGVIYESNIGLTPNSEPDQIVAGPDGNLWFTEFAADKIGRITTAGQVTEFAIPTAGSQPTGITLGPDGDLWFTESAGDQIGRIDTSGNITEFAVPTAGADPTGITTGPDDALWFTETGADQIGRIDTSGNITEFSGLTAGAQPAGITLGPDNALWFTEQNNGIIGKITTAGTITEYANQIGSDAGLAGITQGPDGNLWFTESTGDEVGRIDTIGQVSQFPDEFSELSSGSTPTGIVTGPDDNLWFTEPGTDSIGQIDVAGDITEFSEGISEGAMPYGITVGPDPGGGGTPDLFFTESGTSTIGEISTSDGSVTEFGALTSGSSPEGITLGPDNNLWFAEAGGNGIRGAIGEISPGAQFPNEYTIGLSAGASPTSIVTDPNTGDLYFTETTSSGGKIGQITTAGVITEFTIPTNGALPATPKGIALGPDGNLWFTDSTGHAIDAFSPSTGDFEQFTTGLSAADDPTGITASPDSNLWFTEANGNEVGRITTSGSISLFAVPTPNAGALGITAGPDDNLWFTEANPDQIGQVVLPQSITSQAGTTANLFEYARTVFEVATFQDLSGATNATNFDVTIDYGDGSFGPGEVLPINQPDTDGGLGGIKTPPAFYMVLGTHAYTSTGTFTTSIVIGTGVGDSTAANGTVNVTAALNVTADPINGTINRRANTEVATFTDAQTPASAGDFTANIDWGDGTTPTTGTIIETSAGGDGSPASFAVYGDHDYSSPGSFPVSVTVEDTRSSFSQNNTATATIADVPTKSVFNETGSDQASDGPTAITLGPDGNLWYTDSTDGMIGTTLISSNNESIGYSIPSSFSDPSGITSGPDGALWFTEANSDAIGRITTAGTVTNEFTTGISQGASPDGITLGPDGNLWFTEPGTGKIGRITPQGVVTEFSTGITAGQDPTSIVAGSDGNLWFVGPGSSMVGRITTAGVITEFSGASSQPNSITKGSDGNLWFTEPNSGRIGTINPSTFLVTEYSTGEVPNSITSGPDGSLWFTGYDESQGAFEPTVSRITTAGVTTTFSVGLTANSDLAGIVNGGDGNLYFTETAGDRIGQVVLPAQSVTITAGTFKPVASESSTGTFATFTDTSMLTTPLNFSATIDYGDGTSVQFVTVSENGQPGSFFITGTHTYATAGTYHDVITVLNDSGQNVIDGTVTVSPPFTLTADTGNSIATRAYNGVVADLISNVPDDSAASYTATINWGDGTSTSGIIDPELLHVAGNHAYATSGNFTVMISVTEASTGYSTSTSGTITVAASPAFTPINETDGTTSSGATPGLSPASEPNAITLGPDGNLWFSEAGDPSAIGHISTSGVVFEVSLPSAMTIEGITTGPDGNLYYTDQGDNAIGQITTAGVVTLFTTGLSASSGVFGITSGPDGNLWFTEEGSNKIGRITTAGVITEFAIPTANAAPENITAGSDGALWFTEEQAHQIGRIDTSGNITEFELPDEGDPTGITSGPNGNIWFTDQSGDKIGTVNVSTDAITEFAIPTAGSGPSSITSGPDGNLYFTEQQAGKIGQITTAGVITEFATGLTVGAFPTEIVAGSDGNLYFTEQSSHNSLIGQVILPSTSVAAAPTQPPTLMQGQSYTGGFATFTDNSSLANLSNFEATINYGDGTTGTGTIVVDPNGGFDVTGTHQYSSVGTYSVVVTISNGTGSTSVTDTVNVVGTITPTGVNVSADEGESFTGTVATFTDSVSGRPTSDYVATINWGDSTTSIGTITAGPNGESYIVTGTHTYATSGSFSINTVIQVIPGPSYMATASSTATVAALTINATGQNVAPQEGEGFTGAVADFTDSFGSRPLSDYSGMINWGDGTMTVGTIGAGSGFDVVTGSHTYGTAGSFTITTSISVVSNTSYTGTATSTASVAALTINAVGQNVATKQGQSFTSSVADFTDSFGARPLSDYAAMINWGDGSSSVGTIGAGSGFDVITGMHTYGTAGSFTITTSISVDSNSTYSGTATSTATVAALMLSATGQDVFATQGRSVTSGVATFTDSFGTRPFSDYSAMINWGDGTTTVGTIGAGPSDDDAVFGTHTYATSGTFSVTTTISVIPSPSYSTTATAPATVTPASTNSTITAGGQAIHETQGVGFTSAVASFTDTSTSRTIASYSATINWGDGTTSTGAIQLISAAGAATASYQVIGTHTYAAVGSFAINVTIDATGPADSVVAVGDATVMTVGSTLTASGVDAYATQGNTFDGPVANFFDTSTTRNGSDYYASINWGDGSVPSIGLIQGTGTPGGYRVIGSHVYATLGQFAIKVSIGALDPDDATTTTSAAFVEVAGPIQEVSQGISAPTVGITVGPDGNLWFTQANSDTIGRITTGGQVTEFTQGITPGSQPLSITSGSDDNLWFTEANGGIGRITPSGVVTQFGTQLLANPELLAITNGPDGNLWFTEGVGAIGRITTTGVITNFTTGLIAGAVPGAITQGPDGNLWFAAQDGTSAAYIGRITTSGVITEFALPNPDSGVTSIVAGPDGALWFTEGAGHAIGRITTSGVITEFSQGLNLDSRPDGITLGPDGNLWFADTADNHIDQITPSGVISTFAIPSSVVTPLQVVTGPDRNLWFTEGDTNQLGQVVMPQSVIPTGVVLTGNPGQTFTGTFASFRDLSTLVNLTQFFTPSIAFGDGTYGTGALVADGTGGFNLESSHSYSPANVYNGLATITDAVGVSNPAHIVANVGVSAPSLSFVVTNINDSGPGSFRQAILDADQQAGSTITFAIPSDTPVVTISLLTALPAITVPITINATSQAVFEGSTTTSPLVELDGRTIFGQAIGLEFAAGSEGSLLEGISVFGFKGPLVELESSNDMVMTSYLGLRADGTSTTPAGAATNYAADGVLIDNDGVLITGDVIMGNVISGNAGQGVEISGDIAFDATIYGNIIGLDPTGTNIVGNAVNGISVGPGAAQIFIGPGNVISGNKGDGIALLGDTSILIVGNRIGTDITGEKSLGNGFDGIELTTGTVADGQHGSATVSSSFVSIGGTVLGDTNLISGNGNVGIAVEAGSVALIRNNLIGTDLAGEKAIGNGIAGVLILDSSGTFVGPGNVISGNGSIVQGAGVWIDGSDSTGNLIYGDYIGTDLTGEKAIANSLIGVLINESPNNTVGGLAFGDTNLISGNISVGVAISGAGATGNLVIGNLIGTDATGMKAIPNGSSTSGAGVYLLNASDNTIGGTVIGSGNVISGNAADGVQLFGPTTTGNLVEGNKIGTNIDGTLALGNGDDGVVLNGSPKNQILANIIAANAVEGITVSDATGNVIQANAIGQGYSGQALGNGGFGIALVNGATGNVNANNINVNNVLGPIRDTSIAPTSAPAVAASTKVTAKSITFTSRAMPALQGVVKASTRKKSKK